MKNRSKPDAKPDAKTTASVVQNEPGKSSKNELSDQELNKAAGGSFGRIEVQYKPQKDDGSL